MANRQLPNVQAGGQLPNVHTVETWEIVKHIHPGLLDLDYELSSTKFKIIIGSTVTFTSMYLTSVILSSFLTTYKRLRIKEKVFWHLSIVRAVFGVFSGAFGAWAVFNKTALDEDVVFGTTKSSYFAICATVGFFIFECSALAVSDFVFGSASILLNMHHWFALVGYSIVLYFKSSQCLATKCLLLEVSTPFSALCWTLLKCGKANSFFWKANQFILVHAFHCRNLVECLMLYITYQNWDHIRSSMPWAVAISFYIPLLIVLFVMTPYWTYKKTAQMFNPVDWNFEKATGRSEQNGFAKKVE